MNCSGHKLHFRTRIDRLEYCDKFCSNDEGWKTCTLAIQHRMREDRERDEENVKTQIDGAIHTQTGTQKTEAE